MATIQDIRAKDAGIQRSYSWQVDLRSNDLVGSFELFGAHANNVNIPEKSVETITINHKSRKSVYAGRDSSPNSFTIEFWEDENHSVYNFFDNWMENGISNSRTGGGVIRNEYGIELHAQLLGHDEETVLGEHIFEKVWPQSIGEVTLDYSDSNAALITVTFSYDIHTKTGGLAQ